MQLTTAKTPSKNASNPFWRSNYPAGFFEVIVMDGGSKDATVKIAEQFPIKVVSIRLNAPAAYNYAMKIAAYPIFGFIDADAKVEKDWLNKLVPHLSEPKVAGVSGSIETWNSQNPWAKSIGYELKNRYQPHRQIHGTHRHHEPAPQKRPSSRKRADGTRNCQANTTPTSAFA